MSGQYEVGRGLYAQRGEGGGWVCSAVLLEVV